MYSWPGIPGGTGRSARSSTYTCMLSQRAADSGRVPGDRAGGDLDRGLGGAVQVVAGGVRCRGKGLPQVAGDRLAGGQDDPGPVLAAGQQAGREELVQVGRGGVDEVDALVCGVCDQRGGVGADLVLDQVQLVAAGQQQQPFPRWVEGERGGQRGPQWRAAAGARKPWRWAMWRLTSPVWETTTPLGVPVEPEV